MTRVRAVLGPTLLLHPFGDPLLLLVVVEMVEEMIDQGDPWEELFKTVQQVPEDKQQLLFC